LIEHLIDRARLLNAHDNWEYRVRILVVFGSYIRGVERPITPARSWICRPCDSWLGSRAGRTPWP
jgi:hypothetical protein